MELSEVGFECEMLVTKIPEALQSLVMKGWCCDLRDSWPEGVDNLK